MKAHTGARAQSVSNAKWWWVPMIPVASQNGRLAGKAKKRRGPGGEEENPIALTS
jgi:hypothetical protein